MPTTSGIVDYFTFSDKQGAQAEVQSALKIEEQATFGQNSDAVNEEEEFETMGEVEEIKDENEKEIYMLLIIHGIGCDLEY